MTNKADAGRDSSWTEAALADDVVTLSYEQALHNHARYRMDDRGEWRGPIATAERTPERATAPPTETPQQIPPSRELRTASVTIRLSQAECAQLHRRAAEAGLTVSAYLRSCVLEADALRNQVKQALAEMKATPVTQKTTDPPRASWLRWIGRIANRKR